MSRDVELPPLTLDQTSDVLRRLGDVTEQVVLVGGQALAFWADRYSSRLSLPGSVSSRDIDFGGSQHSVPLAAARLDGTWRLPEPFANTPNSGLVEFVDSAGHTRRIDFLGIVFGLDLAELFEMAIGVEAPNGASFRVMHPIHCLEARIANVDGLPGYDRPLGLAQARAAVLCAKAYLQDRLEEEPRGSSCA